MYSQSELTIERAQSYRDALEHEIKGYEARIARVQAGRPDPLPVEELEARINDVKAEIDRVSGDIKAVKKARDKAEDKAE